MVSLTGGSYPPAMSAGFWVVMGELALVSGVLWTCALRGARRPSHPGQAGSTSSSSTGPSSAGVSSLLSGAGINERNGRGELTGRALELLIYKRTSLPARGESPHSTGVAYLLDRAVRDEELLWGLQRQLTAERERTQQLSRDLTSTQEALADVASRLAELERVQSRRTGLRGLLG